MATKYLWSGATGTGDGSSFTNAYTTLSAAVAGLAAGDTLLAADDHAESVATFSITFPGTYLNPNIVLCVNRGTGNISTGATITASTSIDMHINGSAYLYGVNIVEFSSGGGGRIMLAGSGNEWQLWDNCLLDQKQTGANGKIILGQNSTKPDFVMFLNTTLGVHSSNFSIQVYGNTKFEFDGIILSGAVAPTKLFDGVVTTDAGQILAEVRNSDLSLCGSNGLVNLSLLAHDVLFTSCKLGSSFALTQGTAFVRNRIEARNCDSGDTNFINAVVVGSSTILTDTGVYLTSGGATTKHNGADVPLSLKMSPASDSDKYQPLYTSWQSVFNDTTGSRALSVKCAYDAGAGPKILKDNEIWLEFEALETTGVPLATLETTAPDLINSGTSLTDTAETWTGTSGWTAKKTHTLSKTVTIAEQGAMRWRIGAAHNASISSVYVDNKAALS